ILFPDEDVEKAIISLSFPSFRDICLENGLVRAGAGLRMNELLSFSCRKGLTGFEGLAGIPGTIGGALVKNASCEGSISDHLVKVLLMDGAGNMRWVSKDEMGFGYRSSSILSDEVVVEGVFSIKEDDPDNVRSRVRDSFLRKMRKQPLEGLSLGSVFKNPEGMMAWELVDQVGMRGYRSGGAVVSVKHANFILNGSGARAEDVKNIIGEAQRRIRAEFGMTLELEIEVL
ncbi:MAG: UDP-N-acetylmuramate dehydrogenase, partial [Candidatus Omnitrophica bacterium]|nr:UDP-N-acetylmuramate dehydrogenase [Candidatus Omnitrophota bacterium]